MTIHVSGAGTADFALALGCRREAVVDASADGKEIVGAWRNDASCGGVGGGVLNGGAGSDTLITQAGRDTILRGAGDDRIVGSGSGRAIVIGGGAGRDTAVSNKAFPAHSINPSQPVTSAFTVTRR